MALYALCNSANVVDHLVNWDGTNAAQFLPLVPAIVSGATPNPGDTFSGGTVTPGNAGIFQTNRAALQTKAVTALTTNATYLALASPSVAQNTAQLQALTRQVTALIRIALGRYDSTSGT